MRNDRIRVLVIRDIAASLLLLLYKPTGFARAVCYYRSRGSAPRTESFLHGNGQVFEWFPPNWALLRDQRTRRNKTMLCRIRCSVFYVALVFQKAHTPLVVEQQGKSERTSSSCCCIANTTLFLLVIPRSWILVISRNSWSAIPRFGPKGRYETRDTLVYVISLLFSFISPLFAIVHNDYLCANQLSIENYSTSIIF